MPKVTRFVRVIFVTSCAQLAEISRVVRSRWTAVRAGAALAFGPAITRARASVRLAPVSAWPALTVSVRDRSGALPVIVPPPTDSYVTVLAGEMNTNRVPVHFPCVVSFCARDTKMRQHSSQSRIMSFCCTLHAGLRMALP